MNVAGIIRGVRPRGAAKWVEAELDCTPRQAWRIVSTGRVPGRFRALMLAALNRAIEENDAAVARLRGELKEISYEAMVGRAAARRAQGVGAPPASAPRQDRRQ